VSLPKEAEMPTAIPVATRAARRRVFSPGSPLIRRVAPPDAPSVESFIERLERMGYERRLAAYRAGRLTRRERTVWAARFPDEVPLINGELEWIALASADLD
jgi:hypothetical protein